MFVIKKELGTKTSKSDDQQRLALFRYLGLYCTEDQQESRAVAEKPHDDVVKFDTYRNLQRHRAVLPAIARHPVIARLSR